MPSWTLLRVYFASSFSKNFNMGVEIPFFYIFTLMIEYEHSIIFTKQASTKSFGIVLFSMDVMINDGLVVLVVTTTTIISLERIGLSSVSWIKEWLIPATLVLSCFYRTFAFVFFSLGTCSISYALNENILSLTTYMYFCSSESLYCASF